MLTKEQIIITQQRVRQQQVLAEEMLLTLKYCDEQLTGLQEVVSEQCAKSRNSQEYFRNLMRLQIEIYRLTRNVNDVSQILSQLEPDSLDESQVTEFVQAVFSIRRFISTSYAKISYSLLDSIDQTLKARCFYYLERFNVCYPDFKLWSCDLSKSLCIIQNADRSQQKQSLLEFTRQVFGKHTARNKNYLLYVVFQAPQLYPLFINQYVYQKSAAFFGFFSQFVLCEGIFVQRTYNQREIIGKGIHMPKTSNLLYYYIVKTLGLQNAFLASSAEKEMEYNLCLATGINIIYQATDVCMQSKNMYKELDFKQKQKIIQCTESKLNSQIKNQIPQFAYQQETHFLQFFVVQLLVCYMAELEEIEAFLIGAVRIAIDQLAEQLPNVGQSRYAAEQQAKRMAQAVASEIFCPSAVYMAYLILAYAKYAEDTPSIQFCIYDLVQTLNILAYIQNEYIFATERSENVRSTFQNAEAPCLAEVPVSQCYENIVSQSYFNLNNKLGNPSSFINYLLIAAYYQVFYAGKLLFDKFDQQLFPAKPAAYLSPIVIEQAAVVMNHLQKMLTITNAVKILGPKLKMQEINFQSTGIGVFQIPQYKAGASYEIIEQRVYFLLRYLMNEVQVRDNAVMNILQKINTFSFINDYICDTSYCIGQKISYELKNLVQYVITKLIALYNEQVWVSLQRKIDVANLCKALKHAYNKWLMQQCISQAECDKVLQQLEIYEKQHRRTYSDDHDAYLAGTKLDNADADQESDSGSSNYTTTSYYNDANKVYSKLKSKTLYRAITSVMEAVNQQLVGIFENHRDCHIYNRDVRKRMSDGMIVAVGRYEMFQSICNIAAVSQKYYEQVCQFSADDMESRCKELFE